MWMPVNENWGDTISTSVAGQTDFFAQPRDILHLALEIVWLV